MKRLEKWQEKRHVVSLGMYFFRDKVQILYHRQLLHPYYERKFRIIVYI